MTVFKYMDHRWKYSYTDTHLYFVGSPFSQWWTGNGFHAPVHFSPDERPVFFNCAEQYMMAGKAMLFDDEEALARIMLADSPKEQKAIGREVKNFDVAVWAEHARDVVTQGNLEKFSQDGQLREFLFATGDKILVEGAWYDPVWGVKLAWDDPKILDEANWQGTNWLGQCLMEVRKRLFEDLLGSIHPGHFR